LDDIDKICDGIILHNGRWDSGKDFNWIHKGFSNFPHFFSSEIPALGVKILKRSEESSIGGDSGRIQQGRLCSSVVHDPLSIFIFHLKYQLTDILAVIGGFQHRNAGNRFFHCRMRVPDEECIQTVSILSGDRFHAGAAVFTLQPIMDRADDNIRFALQLVQDFSSFINRIGKLHIVVMGGIGFFPLRNMGSVNSEYGDFDTFYVKNLICALIP